MTSKRKRVSVLRTLGALLLAAAISYGLLRVVDLLVQRFFGRTALTTEYYVLAGICAVFLFLLLLLPANRPFRGTKVFLRWLLIIVGVVVIWGAGSVWNLQNEIMYSTQAYEPQSETEAAAVPEMEAVEVQGKGGTVYKGWLWKTAPEKAGLVMYFGGNQEYAANSLRSLALSPVSKEVFKGYHVLMMDYPGYGQSQGTPGEENIYQMALAAWDQMAAREDINPEKMVPMGWSLGTGTAARLAAEKQPAGLILTAPFYNGGEMINAFTKTQFVNGFTEVLVRNKYTSDAYARDTRTNALIIGATNDRMFPIAQAEKLAAEYPQHTLVKVEGTHNDARFSAGAVQAIRQYLEQVLAK